MKELCDADSSADEPTEESADKSDPGGIDVVDEDEDESQTTLALVCGNSATNKRTSPKLLSLLSCCLIFARSDLSLLYSFGHEDASIVAEIDVNAPLCSSIPNEVIQHGACLGLGYSAGYSAGYYGVPRLFNYGIGIHLLQSEDPKNMPKICQINPKDNHISFQEAKFQIW
ncbi:unnamed protein product [Camellia sinensis]